MQDSMNRGWDEQFVDSAWGEMHQMLDQELPVVASKGSRGWVLLLILFFILGLVLGGFRFYLADSPTIEYFPIPQRGVALQAEPQQIISSVQQSIDNQPQQETEILTKLPLSNNIRASNTAESSFSKKQKGKTTNNSTFSTATGNADEKNRPIAEDITSIQPEIDPFTEQKTILKKNELIIASEILDKSYFLPIEELSMLPVNGWDSPLISIGDGTHHLLLPSSMIASTKLHRFDWGAEIGGTYYDGPGYFGGLQASYYLGKRWGLQSGLYYGQMVSGLNNTRRALGQASALETAQKEPDSGLINNLDQQQRSEAAAINYYNVDIQLQQLSSPILLTYQLSPKWQLGAGVQVHYLLTAKRPAQNTTADKTNATGLNFSSYDRQITGAAAPDNTIDSQLFQQWNMGASFGVGFQTIDRWSVHLCYEYGLFNWLEEDRFFIPPTNLQLSAVYRLNK